MLTSTSCLAIVIHYLNILNKNLLQVEKNLMIHENILSTIGNTPIVKKNQGIITYLKCKFYVKCEQLTQVDLLKFLELASIWLLKQKKNPRIKPGDTLIELFRKYWYWISTCCCSNVI